MNSILIIIGLVICFLLIIGLESTLFGILDFFFPKQKRLAHEQFNAHLEEEEGFTPFKESAIVNCGEMIDCRITLYDTCFYCNQQVNDYDSITEIVRQKLPLVAYQYTFKFKNQSPSFYYIAVTKKNSAEFQDFIDFMVSKNSSIRVGTI